MVEIFENGLRKSETIFVLILQLVLHILSHLMTIIFRAIMDLGDRVPNLRLVELSPPYIIPLINFVGRCILDFMWRDGISFLSEVSWETCNGIIHQSGLPLGLISF